MSRIYTTEKVAYLLDLSERRVQELAAELEPAPAKFGRSWAFDGNDLERLRSLHESKRKRKKDES